jgi:RNA-binding protein YhbY
MKKKEVVRAYNFSDGKLVTTTNEKIAFIRRDAAEFIGYGITSAMVDELETQTNHFSETTTDVELVGDQTEVTKAKDAIADKLQEVIRSVMSRVVLKYPVESAKYRKFGTEALSHQSDAELMVIAARVYRVGNLMLADLAANGLTAGMLEDVKNQRGALEHELIDMKLKIADRDIEQEIRVEAGNAIYATLIKYTNTGQSIWETSNVAKYNDYVVYNTPTGDAPTDPPTPTP